MAEIEFMVYQEGIPEDLVTSSIVSAANAEQRPQNKIVTSHTEVWDGPVAEASQSPYATCFPEFILKPRFQDQNRVKVLSVELGPLGV